MTGIQVTLVYLIKDNQILLAMKKRGFGEGRFNGVGGKVEPGETLEQAAIRETKEEIDVDIIDFEKMADIVFDEYVKGQPEIVHMHVFIASKWQGIPAESEEMAPQWFNINKLPYETMLPDDPFWLPQVLAGQKVTAKFKIDKDDNIVSHSVKIVDGF